MWHDEGDGSQALSGVVSLARVYVTVPKHETREMRALTEGEWALFTRAARDDRLYALYVLDVAAGLRLGEITGLQWSDLDLDKGQVTASHQVQRDKDGRPRLVPLKTKTSKATIGIPASTVDVLKQHRKRQLAERMKVADVWQDNDLVFCTEVETPLNPSNIRNRSFYPILKKAGLPRTRFHDLRHTCATLLLAHGVHPKLVQAHMRHARMSTTMDLYCHVIPEMMDGVTSTFDSVFTGEKSQKDGRFGLELAVQYAKAVLEGDERLANELRVKIAESIMDATAAKRA